MNDYIVFDVESNNLLRDATEIHCISLYDLDTDVVKLYTKADLPLALKIMENAKLLVGHNIAGFDIPVQKKLLNLKLSLETELYDTLLAGCILWPEELRSLEDWASILKLPIQKIQNEDWSVYTPNMGLRCCNDVKINAAVYRYIKLQPHEKLIGQALQLEQEVAGIHAQQVQCGVAFDIEKAEGYVKDLDEKLAEQYNTILQDAPWSCLIPGIALKNQAAEKAERTKKVDICNLEDMPPFSAVYLKGTTKHNQATCRYFGSNVHKVQGIYTKVEFRPFNPDSPVEVKDYLLSVGWEPTEWNIVKDKLTGEFRATSPKLTEDSYDSLPDGLGKAIGTYNTLKHRRNFLESIKDEDKGAIRAAKSNKGYVVAEAFTCGTPTGRYRHSGTVCNIPRVTSIFGKELRSLFGVPHWAFQIGADLSGIEARMLAHFLILGNYKDAQKTADLILSPDKGNDFHSYNAKVWGVSRDTAKTCLYALMYGAGAKKLARILGRNENQGAAIKKDFYAAHPAIKELNDALVAIFRSRGYLIGFDGRPLYIRGENKLLNTLLQHAAAIVFKRWMVGVSKGLDDRGPIRQMIAYHDEMQYRCDVTEETAKEFGTFVCQVAEAIGVDSGCKVPIAAEFKIGKNWADCH